MKSKLPFRYQARLMVWGGVANGIAAFVAINLGETWTNWHWLSFASAALLLWCIRPGLVRAELILEHWLSLYESRIANLSPAVNQTLVFAVLGLSAVGIWWSVFWELLMIFSVCFFIFLFRRNIPFERILTDLRDLVAQRIEQRTLLLSLVDLALVVVIILAIMDRQCAASFKICASF